MKKKQRLINLLIASTLTLMVGGISYVFAQPSQLPSFGVSAPLPLNEGPLAQTKTGQLTLDTLCLGELCQSDFSIPPIETAVVHFSATQNITCDGHVYANNTIYLKPRDYYYYDYGNLNEKSEDTYGCHPSYTDTQFDITVDLPPQITKIINPPKVKCWLSNSSFQYTTDKDPSSSEWTEPDITITYLTPDQVRVTGKCFTKGTYHPAYWLEGYLISEKWDTSAYSVAELTLDVLTIL